MYILCQRVNIEDYHLSVAKSEVDDAASQDVRDTDEQSCLADYTALFVDQPNSDGMILYIKHTN